MSSNSVDNNFFVRPRVSIVNYGVGNLFSVKKACELNGFETVVTYSSEEIKSADMVILPGVGAFGTAIEALKRLRLIDVIKETVLSGKPFVGICLGMQLLMERSFEFGEHEGLGIIKGEVVRFDNPRGIKIPQVGWNSIYNANTKWEGTVLQGLRNNDLMYFVHSYYVKLRNEKICLSKTTYGDTEFCSSFQYKNIFACQFHPERSANSGLKIYKNLVKFMRKTVEV